MARTSRYFDEMTAGIAAHNGVVDKFIGDAVMALWNAPIADTDHAANACAAALDCRCRIDAFNRRLAERNEVPFTTRFGLHTGEAVVGNVGSASRMNYTVVGSLVNMAARLEGLNKMYGTTILASAAIADAAGGRFLFRRVDMVLPKGALTPVEIYELLGERASAGGWERVGEDWAAAIRAYDAQDWPLAAALFRAQVLTRPDDAVATLYADRCRRFTEKPPGPDWTGVTAMDSK